MILSLGIRHISSTAYHSISNGIVTLLSKGDIFSSAEILNVTEIRLPYNLFGDVAEIHRYVFEFTTGLKIE